MNSSLHDILVAKQSDAELRRKMLKAVSRQSRWTQEELDWAERAARIWSKRWNDPKLEAHVHIQDR